MSFATDDIVPLNQVRARLTELAADARTGKEKVITRNGEGYVALIDARRLDYYHRLERERIHITLLDEAIKGMADVNAGRTSSVAEARARYRPSAQKARPKRGGVR
jgi:prevent-host-death family protein